MNEKDSDDGLSEVRSSKVDEKLTAREDHVKLLVHLAISKYEVISLNQLGVLNANRVFLSMVPLTNISQ